MHPFIHPLSAAVDPAWESRRDAWGNLQLSQVCVGHLGKETDVAYYNPLLHDSPAEPLTAV